MDYCTCCCWRPLSTCALGDGCSMLSTPRYLTCPNAQGQGLYSCGWESPAYTLCGRSSLLTFCTQNVAFFTRYSSPSSPNSTRRHFPTLSVLRRHPSPSRQQFEGLLAIAGAVGIQLDVDNSKKLAASLDAATREGDPYFNKLLRILSTR